MKTASLPSQWDESFYYMHGGIVLILWLCITVILRRGDRVKLWEWGDLNLSLGIQQGTRERLTTAHHCFFIFTLAPVFNLEIVWEDFQVFVFHKTLPNNFHPNHTRTSYVNYIVKKISQITTSDGIFNWKDLTGLLAKGLLKKRLLSGGTLWVSLGVALWHNSRRKWKIWKRKMHCNQSKYKKGRRANCRGKMMTMQPKVTGVAKMKCVSPSRHNNAQ